MCHDIFVLQQGHVSRPSCVSEKVGLNQEGKIIFKLRN
jgi:hypothetical protein